MSSLRSANVARLGEAVFDVLVGDEGSPTTKQIRGKTAMNRTRSLMVFLYLDQRPDGFVASTEVRVALVPDRGR